MDRGSIIKQKYEEVNRVPIYEYRCTECGDNCPTCSSGVCDLPPM